jgi:hypothetical protein
MTKEANMEEWVVGLMQNMVGAITLAFRQLSQGDQYPGDMNVSFVVGDVRIDLHVKFNQHHDVSAN